MRTALAAGSAQAGFRGKIFLLPQRYGIPRSGSVISKVPSTAASPVPGCYPETWRALEKIRESGRAKSIGVSNFEEPHLTALFEFSGIIPAVNQIECHPLWNRKPLIAFCRSHGIAVQAYAPLARGLYLNREIMQQLAEKYVRTEAQIGLRYLVQQGISVIPKSTQPDRIFANADVFDFELSEADMALIDTMDEQLRSASIPDDLL